MKFSIKHEIKGRIRVHMNQKRMTFRQADILQYYLTSQKEVTLVKVYEKNQDAVICYTGKREAVISALQHFHYETAQVPENFLENSGRELNEEYKEKLINKVVLRAGSLSNTSGTASGLLQKERLKCRYWMALQWECPYSEEILTPQAPSCSFWESERFWKSGHIRNLWMTLQEVCP